MIDEQTIAKAIGAGLEETKQYGLPTQAHFWLSQHAGTAIALELGADVEIVKLGTALMDLKLGWAFRAGRLKEHVALSACAARDILSGAVEAAELEMVIGCIECHHGVPRYPSVEAEICANADCYRFVHSLGSLTYLATLGKRDLTSRAVLEQSRAKLVEKWSVVSLEPARRDLEQDYQALMLLLNRADEVAAKGWDSEPPQSTP